MNRSNFFLLLVMTLVVLSSCDKGQDIQKNSFLQRETLEEAVKSYNESLSLGQHEGIIIEGTVEINHLVPEDSEDFYLEFLVSNSRYFRKYDFQYSKANGRIKMPSKIEKGQVTFLGDNLVVQDLENQETYVFLVETFENRINGTSPYLGIGLGSQIYQDKMSLRKSAGNCSCSCKKCSFDCEFNCGAYQASCSCGENSESIACRQCYNASCTPCPPDDEIGGN